MFDTQISRGLQSPQSRPSAISQAFDANLEVRRKPSIRPATREGKPAEDKSAGPQCNACRILIVDRDLMAGDLLAKTLVSDGGYQVEAIQANDLLRVIAIQHVDLVVIGAELNSAKINGFALAECVRSSHPNILIVMLLSESTRDSVVLAFRSGARGVFSRHLPLAEFLDCIEHVRKGFIWAARDESKCLLEALHSIPASNPTETMDSLSLTVRELQVVQNAARGKTNRTIARELGLSEHTVKNYLFRAFDKLGVSSRVELLFYLCKRGYIFTTTPAD